MDMEYFKNQICEELDGAKDYIKLAIELKPMAPAWSKVLVDMSAAELSHATNLNKMMQEYYSKLSETYSEMPDYIKKTYDYTIDMYTEKSAKIRYMHDMFVK